MCCAHRQSGFWSVAITVTVAILAQGTSWAVAVTQAFLSPGSSLCHDCPFRSIGEFVAFSELSLFWWSGARYGFECFPHTRVCFRHSRDCALLHIMLKWSTHTGSNCEQVFAFRSFSQFLAFQAWDRFSCRFAIPL